MVLPRFQGCLSLACLVRGLAGASVALSFTWLKPLPLPNHDIAIPRHAHDSNKARTPSAWAASRAPFPSVSTEISTWNPSDTGFHTYQNDNCNSSSGVGGCGIANAAFTLHLGGSEVGIAAAFLDFLAFCLSGPSRQNNHGTTIEGFCMGDMEMATNCFRPCGGATGVSI